MIRKTLILLAIASLAFSCVSKKVYTELEDRYAKLKKENRELLDEKEDLNEEKAKMIEDYAALKAELDKAKGDRDRLNSDIAAANKSLANMQSSYKSLEKNSDDALLTNMNKNRELLAQLDEKQKALAAEQARLDKMRGDLDSNSKRLAQLEQMMASKDAAMRKLKETLSKALNSFEGKGLTVQQKNGKVYVSMENKLLFNSGSWAVGSEGRRAVVEVGKVLGDNPDISVLIEGHTDDDAFGGSGPIADNWDLSTKRATAIVSILSENKKINRFNLTAAGRSEYAPVMPNTSADGKAKNRRIEIILTPKLDEISKMLNEL